MRYRQLGSTGLSVSEIGFGGEWMDKTVEETRAVLERADAAGVNILDCWMPDPTRRSNLGDALAQMGARDRWVIQGHLGSTWQDGQYVRTREMEHVRPAFEDLLARFHTDYMDLGMIHYVDRVDEFRQIMDGSPFIRYVRELRDAGTVRHVGLSTHNPDVARLAVEDPEIEMILFSVNPAFDMLPASEDIDDLFGELRRVARGHRPAARRPLRRGRAHRDGHHGHEGLRGRPPARCRDLAVRRGAHAGPVHPLRAHAPGGGEHHGGLLRAGPRGRGGRLRDGRRGGARLRERAGGRPRARLLRRVHVLRPLRPVPARHRHRRRSTSSTTLPPSTTRYRIRCASTTARSR